jgi:HAE1 family hydrophobic/amphiphilic exporter-1
VLFVPSFFVVLQRFDEWRKRRKTGSPAPMPEAAQG